MHIFGKVPTPPDPPIPPGIDAPVDKHAPAKLKRIKNVPYCPCFDHEYPLLRRKRRKAERMFKESKLFIHKLINYDLRKQCMDLAEQKKLKYIRRKIENSSRHQKSLFRPVKLLSGVEPIKKFPNGFANDNELANKFAEFFITRIEKIHKSFISDPYNEPKKLLKLGSHGTKLDCSVG